MEITSMMVEFPSSTPRGKTKGFLAEPKATGRYPGIIVIQEVWGLVENIKDITRRLAAEGYVALAVDLYDGKTVNTLEDGRSIREKISEEMMLKDTNAGFQHLKSLPNAKPNRIGSIGYCMGGGLSLKLACENRELAAAVVFYGRNPSPIDLVKGINCPILGNYAGEDRGITEADVNLLRDTLTKHGKTHDIKIYPGAPHGFFNDTRESYRPEAAKDAWQRVLNFYGKYLQ
jgi:carboxymethylenebutenolidase